MKDRFVLVGGLALLVALLSSVWLLGSKSTAAPAETYPPLAADSHPTAEPQMKPTAVAATTVDLVVALDGLGGAGAFAQAGDHVDVLGFIPPELNGGNAMTRVVLQDVLVLQGSADTVLTLAVSPEQAVFVRSAEGLGVHMFAALRPTDESVASGTPPVVSEPDLRARIQTSH